MSRVAYVDRQYVPHLWAAVRIEDRGYQFADGVAGGRLVDEQLRLARLARSLSELQIAAPLSDVALGIVIREVVRCNRVRDGIVYLVEIDAARVGGGVPGSVSRRLRELYLAHVAAAA